tara:strand:+ start:331 stop:1230 length:900 start_codon:yes stop_codon:yes gene_type:complete
MKKKLLFLGCNHNQVSYLKLINKDNWNIIGVDLNNNAPGKVYCDKFYNVGYDNLEGLIEVGKKEKFNKYDKVFTAASQFAQKGAAHFSSYFKISFPKEKSIDLCLDKTLYYEYFLNNNIPIPKTWYVQNKDELIVKIKESSSRSFYLKSDFSKNPHYVYQFNLTNIPWDKIFWGQDRYLREYYILQEEVKGTSLRLNIYGSRFNVFDFVTGKKTIQHNKDIKNLKIISVLNRFMIDQGLKNWLVKFDIILGNNNYVVLDIGLDPPMRMLKYCKQKSISFEKYYLNQYMHDTIEYPTILD